MEQFSPLWIAKEVLTEEVMCQLLVFLEETQKEMGRA